MCELHVQYIVFSGSGYRESTRMIHHVILVIQNTPGRPKDLAVVDVNNKQFILVCRILFLITHVRRQTCDYLDYIDVERDV